MRKKLFCALMSLGIALSSGAVYAAEPEAPSKEPQRAESVDEAYEYDEETGSMALTGENVSADELSGAGEDLPKMDAPADARWEKNTGNLLFSTSEHEAHIQYRYSIYREGISEAVYSGRIYSDSAEHKVGLPYAALAKMDTGRYYFEVYAAGDGSYSASDICTSDILDYERPDRKLDAPYDLKWDGMVGCWSFSENSSLAFEVERREEGTTKWELAADGIWGRNRSMKDRWDFSVYMNRKGAYRFRVMALSNNIFEAVDSEWSDWSPEFSGEDFSGEVVKELNELLENGAGADELLDALEKKDAGELTAAIQMDSEVRDVVGQAEEKFAREKGISVNTSVASDMADKLSGSVGILGAAFNAGADVRNMTLNITKPAQEKEVDKKKYKNTVQISMTLDGAADTQNLKVPVRITMPIPEGVEPSDLQILHYRNDGTCETIWPYISEGTASFTLTSFSTFVFANPADTEPDLPEDWPFEDVKIIPGNWKYESIRYVYLNGIMNGINGTARFDPDEPLTRGMFATVLYRMAGSPKVEFKNQFEDVKAGIYYSDAVIWAYEEGIVQGLDGGKRYGVEEHITREQIAKMLYEYGKKVQKYALEDSADIDSFPDRDKVSGWAVDYMKWAVGSGMINGRNNGGTYYLEPGGEATRAECAAMLMRFQKKYQ